MQAIERLSDLRRVRGYDTALLALATDLAYLVTALLELPFLRKVIRRWSAVRYRTSGTVYGHYIARTSDYGTPLSEGLLAVHDRPRRMLDVSTGTGHAAREAARRFPEARSYACDLSISMLSQARASLETTPLICCDNAHLPFGDGTFDLVLLQNAPPSLRELARITAPGGWLILGFSAAGRVPRWLPERIAKRLRMYGFHHVDWRRTGHGLYFTGQITVLEDVA